MEQTKAFYSPAEVASLAGVHPATILNYIRDGKLYAVRLSERTIRVPARAVQKLLEPEEAAAPELLERPNTDVRGVLNEEREHSSERVPV